MRESLAHVITTTDAPRLGLTPAEFTRDKDTARQLNEWLEAADASTRVRWAQRAARSPGSRTRSVRYGRGTKGSRPFSRSWIVRRRGRRWGRPPA